MVAPDGKTRLTRTGRSPSYVFGYETNTAVPDMIRTMQRMTRRYAKKGATHEELLELPVLANLRLAINVASCDNHPLVVA